MNNFLLIGKALAQTAQQTDVGPVVNITDYVNAIMPKILGIISGVAVLMIIYAGYIYLTSQGSSDKIGTAKDILVGVITGIVLLFTIGIILKTIGIL